MNEISDAKFALYRALKERTIRRAREDSAICTQYVLGYQNASFHNQWHQFISDNQSGQILAFRDSGKSEQVTIGRGIWEIGKNPNIRIKIATETDDLATKILSKISATILKNERYKEVFPNVRPSDIASWNKMSMTVERSQHHKDPTVEGGGVLTASTGGRADLILFDDISGMRNALYFPRMREQVKESFYNNWLNLLDGPDARWYMVGTPWHELDVVSEVRANKTVPKSVETWVGGDFETPWPERFPSEYFKKRLGLLKQRAYNRAYRGIALSGDESWINPSAIEVSKDRTLKVYDVLQNSEISRFTGIDLGHRPGEENSPTVIFTIGRTPAGKRIPIEVNKFSQRSILDTGRAIINTWEKLRPALIFCENNGAQKYLIDLIQGLGTTGIPIEGYFTGAQKVDLEIGVPSLLAEIETGQWIFPCGSGGDHDDTCKCGLCYWLGEVSHYPLGKLDALMASWLALEALRKVKERGNRQGNFSIWQFS